MIYPSTLLELANASAAAYELADKDGDAEPYLREADITPSAIVKDPDGMVRGFVGTSLTYRVIAIKGTASLKDAVTDARIAKTDFMEARVHEGFLAEHDLVLRQLADIKTDLPLYVTGHSLGGAVATLIALSLKTFIGNLDVRVATYGSPDVGNRAFVKRFNAAIKEKVRVVHNVDIVPRLLDKIFTGYHHVDRCLHLADDGKIIRDPSTFCGELLHILRIVKADLDEEALANHSIDRYIPSLANYRERHYKSLTKKN